MDIEEIVKNILSHTSFKLFDFYKNDKYIIIENKKCRKIITYSDYLSLIRSINHLAFEENIRNN